jgi:hypothetical protein
MKKGSQLGRNIFDRDHLMGLGKALFSQPELNHLFVVSVFVSKKINKDLGVIIVMKLIHFFPISRTRAL